MHVKAFFLLVLCPLILAVKLQAQPASISGRVMDAATNEPLQGANVFLAATTYGVSTDPEGNYTIAGIRPGVYTLVISMIGFEPQRNEIRLFPGDVLKGAASSLESIAYEMIGVEVTGEKDRQWARRFERFEELIIGSSKRAERTRLLNREVVNLEVDGAGRMTAISPVPLRIENEALGYRITYTMEGFIMDPQAGILRYQGEPFFEEMANGSHADSKSWEIRRKEAYLGSMAHLFSSLIQDRTFEEHFQLYQGANEEPAGSRDLLTESAQGKYEISFENPLKVVYTRTTERRDRKHSLAPRGMHEETSYLYLHVPNVTVSADGYYTPPEALTATGVLGERRLADLVPRDYSIR